MSDTAVLTFTDLDAYFPDPISAMEFAMDYIHDNGLIDELIEIRVAVYAPRCYIVEIEIN